MRGARKLQLLSVLSFLTLLIVVSLVGFFHRQVMTNQVLELGEKSHLVLSRAMANALWPHLDALLHQPVTDLKSLKMRPEIAELHALVTFYRRDLPLAELKIYNIDGVTIFSTKEQWIGENQSANPGFKKALQGGVSTQLHLGQQVATTEGATVDHSLLESYIPLRHGQDQHVHGVFEFYQDVTPLLKNIEQAKWKEAVITFVFVGVVLLVFLVVVFRMNRRILAHEENRTQFINQIQHDKQQLEARIEKRTQELTNANLALKIEVDVRRQTEVELCLAASVYQNTTEAIVVTDANGIIESINPAFTSITGYSEEDAVHQPLSLLYSDHHDETFYRQLHEELNQLGKWRGEMWGQRKDGVTYPEFVNINAIYDGDGTIRQFVKVFSDISGIKRSEQQLHFLVHHDPLTGLPNRLLLKDRMKQAFSYAVRFNQIVGIMFLGLDRFTLINEALGRSVGDRILRDVTERLSQTLRDEDSLARVGGDEFVILVTGMKQGSNASRIGRKLLAKLSEPFQVDSERYYLSASIGISLFPLETGDDDAHLKKAEAAMRLAKAQGGNTLNFFTKEIDALSTKRMAIENGLRLALERNELFLYYQPQIHVVTGRLVGVEALIRWKSPELGLVSPVNFIPIAEESDLIIAIGDWVLRSACQQNMLWQEEGFAPIRMAVNLSARQFQSHGLPDKVAQVLKDTGLDSRYLELELTEGMFMRDVQETVDTLQVLKSMNLQLSIDDFGTGYSSLSYLKRFPIHTLKIDRAFVRDIISDPGDAAITRTIISMAKNLGLQVVAEGVASEDQLEFLRTLGCDLVQGFLFSQPVPPEEIALFLEEDQAFRDLQSGIAPKLHSGSGSVIVFPNQIS